MRERISRYRSAIMGFAALWVFCSHILPRPEGGGLHAVLRWLIEIGFGGVDIFIVLSAFGLAHAFRKNPVRSAKEYLLYLGRRLRRIYVIFLPVTFLVMLVDNWSVGTALSRLFLVEQFGVNLYKWLWYIPCILVFYALAPFFYRAFCAFKNKWAMTVCFVLALYLLLFLLRDIVRPDLFAILTRIPDLPVGFLLAEEREGETKRSPAALAPYLLLAAGLVASQPVNLPTFAMPFPAFNVLPHHLIAPGLIVALAEGFSLLSRWSVSGLLTRGLAYVGQLSLEWYCLHEWLWWGKVELLDVRVSKRLLACVFLTLVCAAGFHAIGEALTAVALPGKQNTANKTTAP